MMGETLTLVGRCLVLSKILSLHSIVLRCDLSAAKQRNSQHNSNVQRQHLTAGTREVLAPWGTTPYWLQCTSTRARLKSPTGNKIELAPRTTPPPTASIAVVSRFFLFFCSRGHFVIVSLFRGVSPDKYRVACLLKNFAGAQSFERTDFSP